MRTKARCTINGTHRGKVRSNAAGPMKFRRVNVVRSDRFLLAMQRPLNVVTRRLFSGTACCEWDHKGGMDYVDAVLLVASCIHR